MFTADVLTILIAVGVMTLVEGTTDPLWVLPTLPLWIVIAKFEGLYDADHPRIWHLTTDEVPAIFHWVTLSVAGRPGADARAAGGDRSRSTAPPRST